MRWHAERVVFLSCFQVGKITVCSYAGGIHWREKNRRKGHRIAGQIFPGADSGLHCPGGGLILGDLTVHLYSGLYSSLIN